LTSDGIVEIPDYLGGGTYFVSMLIKEKAIVKKLIITP
jgi:hypothetical protein